MKQPVELKNAIVLNLVAEALHKAQRKHAPMNSPHEGHSVIREELEELWDHVKADTGQTPAALKEAIQVAAMGLRYAVDLFEELPSSDSIR